MIELNWTRERDPINCKTRVSSEVVAQSNRDEVSEAVFRQ